MSNEIEAKTIITTVSSCIYWKKNIAHLLPLALLFVLCTYINTDGEKFAVFSNEACCYGDAMLIMDFSMYALYLFLASTCMYTCRQNTSKEREGERHNKLLQGWIVVNGSTKLGQ